MSIIFMEESYDWKTLTLWDYLCEGNIPSNWNELFLREDVQKILVDISEKIYIRAKECIIYPPINKVFRAFNIPLDKVRVVILAQDPYFNEGSAVGICMSVPKNVRINPTLRSVYLELENEGYIPNKNGSLIHWVEQGCFMLNTALSVEKDKSESHLRIWYEFSEKVLEYVGKNTRDVAWLLMGAKALEFEKYAIENNGHKKFITSHPSPLSAYKGFREFPAFIGSGVFKKINDFLGKKKINY
jgi:uracil-DNA glycosylase